MLWNLVSGGFSSLTFYYSLQCFQMQPCSQWGTGSWGGMKEDKVTISTTGRGHHVPQMPFLGKGRAGQMPGFISPSRFQVCLPFSKVSCSCWFLHSFNKLWHATGIHPKYSLFIACKPASKTACENPGLLLVNMVSSAKQKWKLKYCN